jgi:hypothetical protein
MIQIEITDSTVDTREITRKETGEVLVFREVTGWARLGGPYPERFKLSLERDQPAPAPGKYEIRAESLFVNRYGNLEIQRRPKLHPVTVITATGKAA